MLLTTMSPRAASTKHTKSGFSLPVAIGRRLAQLRQQRRWTLKEMAAKIEVSFSMYTKYEHGHNPPPLDILLKLAELLQTNVEFLLTGARTEGRPLHNTRLLERLQAIEALPAEDLEAVITVLDAITVRREVEVSLSKQVSSRRTRE